MGRMTETIAINHDFTHEDVWITWINALQVVYRFSEALRLSDSLAANSNGVFTDLPDRHELCKWYLDSSVGIYPDGFRL